MLFRLSIAIIRPKFEGKNPRFLCMVSSKVAKNIEEGCLKKKFKTFILAKLSYWIIATLSTTS
jgi:hypothetical protein